MDMRVTNKYGWTPAHYAAEKGQWTILQWQKDDCSIDMTVLDHGAAEKH